MGLTSNTGLLASVTPKHPLEKQKNNVELRCEVTPAPFMLRPYAGLYNPFHHSCSVLCNHPADTEAKEFVKRVKDSWLYEGKAHYINEDLSKFQDGAEKNKTPHDIVTEDMFRRYTETDSRPHTPAPTLASGKSRGSRRCLTPDQPHQRTAIVLDLRRSHSQETLYYHATSDMTAGQTTSATNDRSTLPSLNLSEGAHNRLAKGQCEQLPPLASPLVLSQRTQPVKDTLTVRAPKKTQLKALNLGKAIKKNNQNKTETPVSQRSKAENDVNDEGESLMVNGDDGGGEGRRRGKRRRKGRQGSDRLTSAGLAAQSQQDPETQIAGIGTDSHNPSSRGSIAVVPDDDVITLPVIKVAGGGARKTDSFLDDEMLKYLHREVDEEAIETEFDTKRRYVLEEALRTRPDRPHGREMQALLRELQVPAMSLGDWLHTPRVFSRQNAQFSLPIDTAALQTLTPMNYAARFVTIKKSKQLLYLTVLRKFRERGYRMPIKDIEEGLMLMMGGILSTAQADQFRSTMEWEGYVEEESIPDDIKLTLLDTGYKKPIGGNGDNGESYENTLKFRTWCGLCAICERMYGRFPPREKDPPDGIELSDFTMVETKLILLKVHKGLVEILNNIRER
ncbi:unnamed protein product [Chilo suppressalis]|uniref:Restriction of telomere capping protein 4 n=1 Tax=Chilo suppressalis TaxID=168631 RepID=A0ABN8AZ24_CHISP|nr:unnamed protein product [Chilo suppressalis]